MSDIKDFETRKVDFSRPPSWGNYKPRNHRRYEIARTIRYIIWPYNLCALVSMRRRSHALAGTIVTLCTVGPQPKLNVSNLLRFELLWFAYTWNSWRNLSFRAYFWTYWLLWIVFSYVCKLRKLGTEHVTDWILNPQIDLSSNPSFILNLFVGVARSAFRLRWAANFRHQANWIANLDWGTPLKKKVNSFFFTVLVEWHDKEGHRSAVRVESDILSPRTHEKFHPSDSCDRIPRTQGRYRMFGPSWP